MKKYILLIIFLFSLFIFRSVNAETFVEGKFINGEYINKVIDGKTYYMTMQFINDSKGNVVYCLEPFVKFLEGKSYKEFIGNFDGYNNLTKEQKRKIELITYYGYGYGDRTTNKWYVVTQYLIWQTVDENADIYFTDTLNGNKIKKYSEEINDILINVYNHDNVPYYVSDYTVSYGAGMTLGMGDDYEVVSSTLKYEVYRGLNLIDLRESGNINIRKISNIYKNKIVIYDSSDSQDLIRPGNIENNILTINVNVEKGDITLDIKNDNSVYTIESDFTNTCYIIKNHIGIRDKVCTSNDNFVYKSVELPYGKYEIEQISSGLGYKKDSKIYYVTIDEKNNHPKVILYNQLIKNDVEIIKNACKNDICVNEENAKFEVINKNGEKVDELVTNKDGYTSITLGYGSYLLKQIYGYEGYSLVTDENFKIMDEETKHIYNLYNYFIEPEKVEDDKKEEDVKQDEIIKVEDEKQEEITEEDDDEIYQENIKDEEIVGDNAEVIPPNTKVDGNSFFVLKLIIFSIQGLFVKILLNL